MQYRLYDMPHRLLARLAEEEMDRKLNDYLDENMNPCDSGEICDDYDSCEFCPHGRREIMEECNGNGE
jgi:hypothetical protein